MLLLVFSLYKPRVAIKKYSLIYYLPFFVIVLSSVLFLKPANAQTEANEKLSGLNDFDFMVGTWEVTNHRLKERAIGSNEWETFTNKTEFYEPFMNGHANMDRSWFKLGGRDVEGVSIRVYNPQNNEWTIYWMADVYPVLTEQVRGSWNGDTGLFYGEEEYEGITYRMRFLWKKKSENYVEWEQAYFLPKKNEWETNWKMELRRILDN